MNNWYKRQEQIHQARQAAKAEAGNPASVAALTARDAGMIQCYALEGSTMRPEGRGPWVKYADHLKDRAAAVADIDEDRQRAMGVIARLEADLAKLRSTAGVGEAVPEFNYAMQAAFEAIRNDIDRADMEAIWEGMWRAATAPVSAAPAAEAAQRERMRQRFADRSRTPATADFDLPAPNDAQTEPGAHHLTPENIEAMAADLEALALGESPIGINNRDWITQSWIIAKVIRHLSALATLPPSAGAPVSAAEQASEGKYADWTRAQLIAYIDTLRECLTPAPAPGQELLALDGRALDDNDFTASENAFYRFGYNTHRRETERAALIAQSQGDKVAEACTAAVVAELREYADNPGYSHGDYADTMRDAADAIEAMRNAPADGQELTTLLTDKELADPDYMRAYIGEMQETIAELLTMRQQQGELSDTELRAAINAVLVRTELSVTRDWLLNTIVGAILAAKQAGKEAS